MGGVGAGSGVGLGVWACRARRRGWALGPRQRDAARRGAFPHSFFPARFRKVPSGLLWLGFLRLATVSAFFFSFFLRQVPKNVKTQNKAARKLPKSWKQAGRKRTKRVTQKLASVTLPKKNVPRNVPCPAPSPTPPATPRPPPVKVTNATAALKGPKPTLSALRTRSTSLATRARELKPSAAFFSFPNASV